MIIDFFYKNFPFFNIKKIKNEGNVSNIKLEYKTFCVNIEFYDIKNDNYDNDFGQYLDVYVAYIENDEYHYGNFGSYDRKFIVEKIKDKFSNTKLYENYKNDIRIKKLNRLL